MPYVSRDNDGDINGTFSCLQPGYAEEFLPDDNPEVVAFIESTQLKPPGPTPEQLLLFDHENRIRAQEGAPPLVLEEFTAKLLPP